MAATTYSPATAVSSVAADCGVEFDSQKILDSRNTSLESLTCAPRCGIRTYLPIADLSWHFYQRVSNEDVSAANPPHSDARGYLY